MYRFITNTRITTLRELYWKRLSPAPAEINMICELYDDKS